MDENSRTTEHMPEIIGRYQVQESIGFGAMGAVYKAFDPLIKRTLAIKTIRLDIPRQSPQYKSFIERFYHEARISGTLSHPSIVTLFDIGEESGLPYLAMEFVEGETISSMIERGIRFRPEKVIGLVSQIAAAIDYAHGKGVIHRDIKPSNLILYEGDRVKVTDFGIAKLVDAEMTQAGTLLGTPSYMSPEQAMGDKLDGRSDIFSLGVCAFEMLSGEQPFPGNNVTSILYKLVHVDPVEPANLEMNGLVPQKWHEVFGKVLAKKPDDRYQTATEFVQDLEYCLGSWFGAAMGDDPLASDTDGGATTMLTRADLGGDAPITDLLSGTTDATTAIGKVPEAGATPIAAKQTSPGPADQPATVHMKAQSAEESGATVVIARDSQAKPSSKGKDKTKAKDKAAASARPTELTVRMDSSQLPSEGGAGPTVMMTAPTEETMRAAAGPTMKSTPVPSRTGGPAAEPSAAGPRSKGLPIGLIVGGAVALFVAALVVAGITILKNDGSDASPTPVVAASPSTATTPAPAPPTEAPPVSAGVLHIESQPVGASVTVNGEPKGVTPLDVAGLPLGAHEVKVALKGYEAAAQTVSLSAESLRGEATFALKALAPTTAAVDILSTPFGATVTVDGARVGQTPLTDYKLRLGSHQVDVVKEGHERFSTTLRVEAGKRAKVDAQLKPLKTPPPPPTTLAIDPNKVYTNLASEVDVIAKRTTGTSPSYPENAPRLKSGESVSVTISFVVIETGEMTELKVLESGGKLVDEAVLAAARTWKYSPATKGGVKVKVRLTQKQTFKAG